LEASPNDALASLIHPMSTDKFMRDYWEKGPYLAPDGSGNRFRDSLFGELSVDTVDRVLLETYAVGWRRRDSLYAVQNGSLLDPNGYMAETDGELARFNLDGLFTAYRDGATIVISSIDQVHPAIGHYCDLLSERFVSRIHTTVFVTPPGATGFATHYDTHDVFVVQINGAKEWRLHEGRQLLRTRYFSRDDLHELDGDGDIHRVRRGDVMYVPRGTLHQAVSLDVPSVHLVFGVHPYTRAALLRDLVDDLEKEHELFRRSASLDDDVAGQSNVRAELADLIAKSLDERYVRAWIEAKVSGLRDRRRLFSRRGEFERLLSTSVDGHTQSDG
jgi:ribosomal protein L16 Arg81 hydroxylase